MRPLVFVTALEGLRPDPPQRGPSFALGARLYLHWFSKQRKSGTRFSLLQIVVCLWLQIAPDLFANVAPERRGYITLKGESDAKVHFPDSRRRIDPNSSHLNRVGTALLSRFSAKLRRQRREV
jgi:hypothetical protein